MRGREREGRGEEEKGGEREEGGWRGVYGGSTVHELTEMRDER